MPCFFCIFFIFGVYFFIFHCFFDFCVFCFSWISFGPAEGVRGGVGVVRLGPAEGSRGSAQIWDAPTKILNTHRTDTPDTPDPQHNDGSRTAWSWARRVPRREVPKKQDMSNKLSRRAAPLAIWVQGWFAKVTKRFDKEGGQKWCGPKVVRKTKKTWKNSLLPSQAKKSKHQKINNKIKKLKKCSKKENQIKILIKLEKFKTK